MSFTIPRILIIFAFIIIGVIIYSNTFHNTFCFDDDNSVIENLNIRDIKNIKAIWDFWPMRFVTYLSIAFNYYLGKLNVFGYHLFNLIVHLCSTILVFWLIILNFSTPIMKDKTVAKDKDIIAFFVGLVFLTHPIQTQAVTYIAQRATSMATMFYLLSLCLYVKSMLLRYEKQGSCSREFFYASSIISAVIAMFTKEMTITLPIMIWLYTYCFFREEKGTNYKYLIPFFIALLIIPLTMLVTKSVDFLKMQRVSEDPNRIPPLHYLFTQFRVIITYIRCLLVPVNQNADYEYPVVRTLFQLPVLASFFILVTIIFISIKIKHRFRLISFGIFWFFLAIFPESSIIPIKDVIMEHRLYLPMVGYSLFLVTVIYYLFWNRAHILFFILLIIITNCNSILTYKRNFVWSDGITFWSDVIRKSPNKSRAYNNRGREFMIRGRFNESLSDFNNAIIFDSINASAYSNLGSLYQKIGDITQAITYFNKAIEIAPKMAGTYNNLGEVYRDTGDFDKAIFYYNKAIEINPRYAAAYNNRGIAYQNKGYYDQAIADYNRALEILPDWAAPYINRGNTYQSMGEFNLALSDYNKAIELDPNMAPTYNNRANLYVNKGDIELAITDYNKAIEIDPYYAEAYCNRGDAYLKIGNIDQAISDYKKALEINPTFSRASSNLELANRLKEGER